MTATERGEALPAGRPEAAPKPWRWATLVLSCPTCDATPGSLCMGTTGRHRRRFHIARYELARELAGVPINRTAPPT